MKKVVLKVAFEWVASNFSYFLKLLLCGTQLYAACFAMLVTHSYLPEQRSSVNWCSASIYYKFLDSFKNTVSAYTAVQFFYFFQL